VVARWQRSSPATDALDRLPFRRVRLLGLHGGTVRQAGAVSLPGTPSLGPRRRYTGSCSAAGGRPCSGRFRPATDALDRLPSFRRVRLLGLHGGTVRQAGSSRCPSGRPVWVPRRRYLGSCSAVGGRQCDGRFRPATDAPTACRFAAAAAKHYIT
jgi:hypothetical protein